jgi:hypothetical protein
VTATEVWDGGSGAEPTAVSAPLFGSEVQAAAGPTPNRIHHGLRGMPGMKPAAPGQHNHGSRTLRGRLGRVSVPSHATRLIVAALAGTTTDITHLVPTFFT